MFKRSSLPDCNTKKIKFLGKNVVLAERNAMTILDTNNYLERRCSEIGLNFEDEENFGEKLPFNDVLFISISAVVNGLRFNTKRKYFLGKTQLRFAQNDVMALTPMLIFDLAQKVYKLETWRTSLNGKKKVQADSPSVENMPEQ